MRAVLLCAGFGTRLGALCRELPKPLLQVGDRAIVEHTLEHLARHGVREVHLNLHYLAEQFPERLGDGTRYGVRIRYSYEDRPLGTAGTVAKLAHNLGQGPVLVHYGDVLTRHDLSELVRHHCLRGAGATMLVHSRAGSNSHAMLAAPDGHRARLGACGLEGSVRVLRFIERPQERPELGGQSQWAFSGVCVLGPRVLGELAHEDATDLPRDVFPKLAERGELFAQPLSAYRCAIDSESRLQSARQAFAEGEFDNHPQGGTCDAAQHA